MSNAFSSLAVPAGNGVGASTSFVNRQAKTVNVSGAFEGLLVIEGSFDGGVTWFPIITFESGGVQNILLPWPELRVLRKQIKPNEAAGTPVVTVGAEVALITAVTLPAPVGNTGAGAGVDISGFTVTGAAIAGAFQSPGAVVHIEISDDNVSYAPAAPACTRACQMEIAVSAQYARQRIAGLAAAAPSVGLMGPTIPVCFEMLPMPMLNGPGAAVDTSECSIDKTVIVSAPDRDVPGRIAIEGSNDGGTTWVTAMGWNTTGMRKLQAVFQQMRVNLEGFVDASAVAGLGVGVAAPKLECEACEEGESTDEFSNADSENEFAEGTTLTTPAGIQDGDLLVVAIAITYQPHLLVSPAPPGEVAVVEPVIPADWEIVLPDWPGGTNEYNFGEFQEEDRLAVFKRVVLDAAAEPATHDFTWAAGGGAVSYCAAIKNFTTGIPNVSPYVVDAPASANAGGSAGNPVDCDTSGNTALEDDELLLGFFVARNGENPAPGGTAFSTPAGMADLTTPINLQTSGTADPLGLGMFIETVPAGGVTTRTSTCDITDAPPTPFRGMGYSILIAGCPLPQPPPPT